MTKFPLVPAVTEKACTKCGEVKPLADFPPRKLSQCRVCVGRRDRYRRRLRDAAARLRALERGRTPEGRAAAADRQRRRRAKPGNKLKRAAHYAVERAIKSGLLVRATMCEAPNCFETKHIDSHHPDYNKKLDVMWLCKKCHAQLHQLLKKQEAA